MKLSKKKITGLVTAGMALSVVAGSWAYYTSTNTVDNQMKTQKYGDTLVEEFTPKPDWQPGEKVTKEVGVKNTGDYDIVVRVKMDEKWWDDKNNNGSYDAGEERITQSSANTGFNSVDKESLTSKQYDFDGAGPLTGATDGYVKDDTHADESVVYKEMDVNKWTYNQLDGYWYYKEKLSSGIATSKLLNSITLAVDADMGAYTVTKYYHEGTSEPVFEPGGSGDDHTATGGWKEYNGAVPEPNNTSNTIYTRTVSTLKDGCSGYAGANYDLIITSETCQATSAAVTATWENVPESVVNGWSLSE